MYQRTALAGSFRFCLIGLTLTAACALGIVAFAERQGESWERRGPEGRGDHSVQLSSPHSAVFND